MKTKGDISIGHSEAQSSMETQRQTSEVQDGATWVEMPSFRILSGDQEWPQVLLGSLHEVGGAGQPEEDNSGEQDFEFACVSRDSLDGFEPVAAEEIFSDACIRVVYPLFGRTLRHEGDGGAVEAQEPIDLSLSLREWHEGDGGAGEAQVPIDVSLSLREFLAENEDPPSSSSSASSASCESTTELDGVRAESYCTWAPRSAPASPDLSKKSHSTGTSAAATKKWRFRDLVARRSHSDGKKKFVFVAAPASVAKAVEKKDKMTGKQPPAAAAGEEKKGKGAASGGGKVASEMDMLAAHRLYYMKGGAAPAGERRRSFLPYRKNLLGFFAHVNVAGRSFHPF